MRALLLLTASAFLVQLPAGAQLPLALLDPSIPPPPPKAASNWSELMIDVIYPTSDDLFYIANDPPADEAAWSRIRRSALMMAEAGNLLMMPGRRFDNDRWMRDARLLVDAGIAAYEAAKRKDQAAIEALNGQIYNSCVICHGDYREGYGRRPLADQQQNQE